MFQGGSLSEGNGSARDRSDGRRSGGVRHVSSARVILRWNLQKGVVVISGSSSPDHIKENTELYDFALADEEMAQINALDRNEKHDWY